jgi:hypothetical protein
MPTERRLPKRSVAKDGNKAKKARRGGKAGFGTKEGRVSVAATIDTAAATVAVPETAAAETEAVAVPETAEAEKEGSLASRTSPLSILLRTGRRLHCCTAPFLWRCNRRNDKYPFIFVLTFGCDPATVERTSLPTGLPVYCQSEHWEK